MLLASAGASAGIIFAAAAIHYFTASSPVALPPGVDVAIDKWVLAFTAVLALVTAVIFGVIPAWKASRANVIDSLKTSGRQTSDKSTSTIRNTLVVVEFVLSFVLLIGAGLLTESLARFASVPLGFATDHLLTMSIRLPKTKYQNAEQRARFYDQLIEATRSIPGIDGIAASTLLPTKWGSTDYLTIEGRPIPTPQTSLPDVELRSITPDYFRVMQVPVKIGRPFQLQDTKQSEPVGIVNEALVRRYFVNQNPLGRHLKYGPATEWITIVGVSGNEKGTTVHEEMAWVETPMVLRPVSQTAPQTTTLLVRMAGEQPTLATAIQRQTAALDSDVVVADIDTMEHWISKDLLAYPRFRELILGAFAGLALLLAIVGLYGVLSQSVLQRTYEIGIRMALGAPRCNILTLVLKQGLLLAAIGLFGGLLAASFLTRFLGGLLYGTKPTDFGALFAVSLVLLSTACFASYIPARRAAGLDPIKSLRCNG